MQRSPGHRHSQSQGANNPNPLSLPDSPSLGRQRRVVTPTRSLTLPEDPSNLQQRGRPPSPLRNGFIPDTSTGIHPHDLDEESDDSDHPRRWQRSPSPTSSVSHLAANFVQRVNSFVGGMGPRSPPLLSDAELEAEAHRAREESRREAERILNREAREAKERRLLEERVLAVMESTKALPPPPSRSYGGGEPPSPSNSQKEGWWSTAKLRLLSKEKEQLTPAQQVIQDAKTKEKEKERKGSKGKEREWPANAQEKYTDPAFMNLNLPNAPPRKPVPPSPSSPTPSRPSASNMAPNLTPSPLRSLDIMNSPSREAPPVYAQFNTQGTLDVQGTLLTVVKRFEKLEKWTVGHVRALEERMGDVERWLVEKEQHQSNGSANGHAKSASEPAGVSAEIREMREELAELGGRVGELGREMAKMATAPSNLSSGPSRQSTHVSVIPQANSSFAIHGVASAPSSAQLVSVPMRTPSPPPFLPPITPLASVAAKHTRLISSTAMDTTSPPIAAGSRQSFGTKLPYPTGDYALPPEAAYLPQQATFSPTNSPTASLTSASRSRALSGLISGLPASAFGSIRDVSFTSPPENNSGLPMTSNSNITSRSLVTTPPPVATTAITSSMISNRATSPNLPPPRSSHTSSRQASVSPTPRKRYTVALGGSIDSPEFEEKLPSVDIKRTGTPLSNSARDLLSRKKGLGDEESEGDGDDEEDAEFGEETIGKSSGARLSGGLAGNGNGNGNSNGNGNGTSTPKATGPLKPKSASKASPSSNRVRAQSAYGYASFQNSASQPSQQQQQQQQQLQNLGSVAPLRPRVRSQSSDRVGQESDSGASMYAGGSYGDVPPTPVTPGGNRFVDPLVLRRQEREGTKLAMPRPRGKVPIGQLVAFFDGGEKK